MKRIMLIAALLMATAFSGPVVASEISQASLDKLLMLSGMNKQVSQFPGLLRMGMEQARQRAKAGKNGSAMPDAEYADLENAMVDAFKPAEILQAIGDAVKRTTSEEDARKMLAWFDSALGRRINKAEEDGATPQAYREMAASARALLADQKRVQFAERLDNLLQLTDMTMQLQVNSAVATFVAFSTAMRPDQPVHKEEFRARISAALQRARPNIQQRVILSSVYTYRNIDPQSLEKYLAFLKTPRALQFNKSLMAGMEAGIDQSIDKMARSMVLLVKRKYPQKI